ncbi:Bacteriophage protein [Mycobacteroides abscessus subsp. massiliense]|uniref:serine hydrolase n=1 Tax=Mycobacteroides abscessus TaxID=36809 RepID=UPI0009C7E68E|nr:serine hydrolase [Mycobacteroides abscessus]MBL3742841.1 serine hydrolase [Mycobacteroides abscessus subsp. massiliense]SKM97904.1 Bacteriophage protein [Mycobacteroides abscessus subsp. massiliense]
MAGISVGASDISKLAAGETEATKVSLGPIDVWTAFTPIIENNVARTNYPVPYGATGAWVTLQAAGGAGGEGATGLWTANSGGGGGGRIERTWVPVSEMGATYSVVQGKGGKGDGGDSVFSSGGVNLTAKGGKKGSSGATTVGSSPFTIPGGAGGTYSVTGMSGVRVYPGSPGGDATNTVTNPGATNANNAGAGGGAGGPYSSDTGQTPGGAGGSSTTVTGGAGGTDSVKPGVKPDNATIPNGGAGGGGGAGAWFAAGGTGGDGGRFGGGGGGAGCGNTVATAGKGGDGFTRIEWTAESIEYRRVFVAVTEVNQTSIKVQVNGLPPDAGTVTGYNFYKNGVKVTSSPQSSPEYTFGGLDPNSTYTLTATAVSTGSESSPYDPAVVRTLADGSLSLEDRTAIDNIVAQCMAEDGQPGVMISITGPKGSYTKSYGVSPASPGITSYPLSTTHHFRIGSLTKSFTGTAILMQVDKGILSLDDILEKWIPGLPDGKNIKIRHLLGMRDGLFEFQAGNIGLFPYGVFMLLFPTFPVTVDTQMNIIKGHAVTWPAGTNFAYHNSGMIVLGQILEAATGRRCRDIFKEDIWIPLGLTETSWPDSPNMPEPYSRGLGPGIFGLQDWTVVNPEYVGSAGALVSTIDNIQRWGQAMRDGWGISPEMHAFRENIAVYSSDVWPYEGPSYYGYGPAYFNIANWFGHAGSVSGYNCTCYYEPVSGAVFAGMENVQSNGVAIESKIQIRICEYLYPGTTTVEQPFDPALRHHE